MCRSRIPFLVGSIVMIVTAAISTAAVAHVEQNGRWFVAGHTGNTDGNGRIDPLNVIFRGSDHGDVLKVNATTMLSKWGSSRRGDLRDQGEPGCMSSQGIFYQHPRILDSHQDSNQKTGCYEDAYHVRLWDSKEHDDVHHPNSGDPLRDTWAIMGVHYDECCFDGIIPHKDRIGKPWEVAARAMIKELKEYCSDPSWKHLIGSGPAHFQKRFSDGRLSRISPEEIGPGPCG